MDEVQGTVYHPQHTLCWWIFVTMMALDGWMLMGLGQHHFSLAFWFANVGFVPALLLTIVMAVSLVRTRSLQIGVTLQRLQIGSRTLPWSEVRDVFLDSRGCWVELVDGRTLLGPYCLDERDSSLDQAAQTALSYHKVRRGQASPEIEALVGRADPTPAQRAVREPTSG